MIHWIFGFIPLTSPVIGFWSAVGSLAGDLLGAGVSAYTNHREAALNREWQEKMAKNAIQYRVADLKAAGLNPVLAGNMNVTTPAGSQAAGLNANFSNSAKAMMQLQQQEAENTVEKGKKEVEKLDAEIDKIEKETNQTPTLGQDEVNAIARKQGSSEWGRYAEDIVHLGENFMKWLGVLPQPTAQQEAEERIRKEHPDMPDSEVKAQASLVVKEAEEKNPNSAKNVERRDKERHEATKKVIKGGIPVYR